MFTYRKARMRDAENLHALINDFAGRGLMLPRSLNTIYESLREFIVIESGTELAGFGALHIIWEDLAEIRALAIRSEYQRQGIGTALIGELLDEARNLGIHQVFALTYQVGFFKHCGFTEVTKEEMPHKVWKECINCPKFPNCDEVAMLIKLDDIRQS